MKNFKILLIIIYVVAFNLYSKKSDFAYPIDIVYTWVNGNDPEWKALKDEYLKKDGAIDSRFMDHEELRYSLRSVFKYASFFNHIYIVTMNQRPEWLLDHPKISIVDHKDIFKNIDYLPTFNSHAIESNLHRIPNLSEYFLYFNDDVFLGDFVTSDNFFVDDKVNVLFEKSLSPSGEPIADETMYRKAWRNTNALLDMHFKKENRYRLCHIPAALRKSYIQDFDKEFPYVFDNNSSHKFRCEKDFNVTNGLLHYYWLYKNKVVNDYMGNMMVTLWSDDSFDLTKDKIDLLKLSQPTTFCLQDNMDVDNSDLTRQLLSDVLQELYPEKAPWEKK